MNRKEHRPEWLHDPKERRFVLRVRDWEIRALRRSAEDYGRIRRRGGMHVQLWHRPSRTSVLTPSSLTNNRFEVCRDGGSPVEVRPPKLHDLVEMIASVELPPMREIALMVEWFARPGRRPARMPAAEIAR